MPGVTTLPSNTLMIIGEADTINDVKLQLTKSYTLAGALVPGNPQDSETYNCYTKTSRTS
jgi:hypothetical protein